MGWRIFRESFRNGILKYRRFERSIGNQDLTISHCRGSHFWQNRPEVGHPSSRNGNYLNDLTALVSSSLTSKTV